MPKKGKAPKVPQKVSVKKKKAAQKRSKREGRSGAREVEDDVPGAVVASDEEPIDVNPVSDDEQSMDEDVFALPDKSKKLKNEPKAPKEAATQPAEEQGSDEDSMLDEEEYLQRTRWGKKADDYYGGDEGTDDEADSAEESEDEKLLEKEAAFVHKKALRRLRDEDFALDEVAGGADVSAEVEDIEDLVTRVETKAPRDLSTLSDKQLRKVVVTESKEFLPLMKDLEKRLSEVEAMGPLRDSVDAGSVTDAGKEFVETKYLANLQSLSNLAMYLALKANGANLTNHSVLARIMEAREQQAALEKFAPSGREVEGFLRMADEDDEADLAGDDEAASGSDMEEIQPAKKDKSRAEKLAELRAAARKQEAGFIADLPDVESLMAMPEKRKKNAGASIDPSLRPMVKKKNAVASALNFAKQSMEMHNRQEAAAKKSGDTHVDYKERPKKAKEADAWEDLLKQGMKEDKTAPAADEADGEGAFAEAMGVNEEEMSEEALRKKAKAEAKEAKYRAKKLARLPASEDIVEDQRKASYAILKNKGLTRFRKKENRNSRVKLKNKYDKAVKRNKGLVREMREGKSDGGYEGEATGVRTRVQKSIKIS